MTDQYDNEFIREETSLDRDFTIVANAWILDKRIVGNSLSIYLGSAVGTGDSSC